MDFELSEEHQAIQERHEGEVRPGKNFPAPLFCKIPGSVLMELFCLGKIAGSIHNNFRHRPKG